MRSHTQSNTNVRAVRARPTRHPFHTFNKRRSTQSRHRHCNVFGQRVKVRLRLHTESITNNMYSSNINVRAVHPGRANTTPISYIQRTKINADPSSPLYIVYTRVRLRPHILHRSPITPPNSSAYRALQINVHTVRPGPTRHPFHTCIKPTKINAEQPSALF